MIKNVSRIEQPPAFILENGVIVGFGSPELRVEAIESWLCRSVISVKHYSRRFVNNGYVHLGIFSHRHLVGVMQWGYALTPTAANGWFSVLATANTKERARNNFPELSHCRGRHSGIVPFG